MSKQITVVSRFDFKMFKYKTIYVTLLSETQPSDKGSNYCLIRDLRDVEQKQC